MHGSGARAFSNFNTNRELVYSYSIQSRDQSHFSKCLSSSNSIVFALQLECHLWESNGDQQAFSPANSSWSKFLHSLDCHLSYTQVLHLFLSLIIFIKPHSFNVYQERNRDKHMTLLYKIWTWKDLFSLLHYNLVIFCWYSCTRESVNACP